jgi:hypothetical protein
LPGKSWARTPDVLRPNLSREFGTGCDRFGASARICSRNRELSKNFFESGKKKKL